MKQKVEILYPNKDKLNNSLKDMIFNLNESNQPALGALKTIEYLQNLYVQSLFCAYTFAKNQLSSFAFVMNEKSTYKSPNYLYFKNKYSHFLYIDRIAVANMHQRKGIGSLLYKKIYQLAINNNVPLCCEVNTNPRNDQSIDFHQKNNFEIIEEIPFGNKMVAMMVKK